MLIQQDADVTQPCNMHGGKKGSHKKAEVISIKTPLSYGGVRVFAHSVVEALGLS